MHVRDEQLRDDLERGGSYMVEFAVGYLMGVVTMCIFQITKEEDNEEEKTSDKSEKHTKHKR